MKKFNEMYVIGIDHGYGNMKTANCCFKTGLLAYDAEPLFTGDMLVYDGKYYLIGEGHKEFLPDKIRDEDYYILTLVAIAKELQREKLTEAKVIIAAGLPLTWTSGQKKDFAAYLSKNKEVSFTYQKVDYHITIEGARIYPQGYAAIADFATTMTGVNMVADAVIAYMNKESTDNEALLENIRQIFREEVQTVAVVSAPPAAVAVTAELTEEQKAENAKNVLAHLEMFG